MKQLGIFIACLIGAVFVISSFRNWYRSRQKCRKFIALYNPGQADNIIRSVTRHNLFFFPTILFVALLSVESDFDPNASGSCGEKGIGQLTEIAVLEIERVYKMEVDRSRLFEIDYNIYLVWLFLNICRNQARRFREDLPLNHRTLLTYHDWLTWDIGTYQYADKVFDIVSDIERI